jgi:hypothetical protein
VPAGVDVPEVAPVPPTVICWERALASASVVGADEPAVVVDGAAAVVVATELAERGTEVDVLDDSTDVTARAASGLRSRPGFCHTDRVAASPVSGNRASRSARAEPADPSATAMSSRVPTVRRARREKRLVIAGVGWVC